MSTNRAAQVAKQQQPINIVPEPKKKERRASGGFVTTEPGTFFNTTGMRSTFLSGGS